MFNSRSSALYVDDKNKIEFLPVEIEIVRQLGQLCLKLAGRLSDELVPLQTSLKLALPQYPQNTEAALLISRLSVEASPAAVPNEAEIRKVSEWDNTSESELDGLTNELAGDPLVLAQQRERCLAACDSLAKDLNSIEPLLSDDSVAEIETKYIAAVEARSAATLAADVLSKGEKLPHIGSEPWRKMFH